MSNYTRPAINKNNPEKWFVYYNFMVPEDLRHLYSRGWKRFKVYAGINRFTGVERERAANDLVAELSLSLRNGWLNPFDSVREAIASPIELKRTDMLCKDVLPLFMKSRSDRKLDANSISSYRNTVGWLLTGIGNISAGDVKFIDVSTTINKVAALPERSWGATTINKEWDFVQTIFNWLVLEDYMVKNPVKGKIIKLPTKKGKHKWYDKDTAILVKNTILKSKSPWLLNVCQFTYEILIRSKNELRNIKVGDIDMDLGCVNFRKEWTKNSSDQTRDYSDAFHLLITKMNLANINKDWYIFGKNGKPGPGQGGHNYFSLAWAKIRDELGLSDQYTIYGWKHTAIVHDMMKGTDGYTISYRARHSDTKTTDDYKRDYDITLNRVYSAEDLCF